MKKLVIAGIMLALAAPAYATHYDLRDDVRTNPMPEAMLGEWCPARTGPPVTDKNGPFYWEHGPQEECGGDIEEYGTSLFISKGHYTVELILCEIDKLEHVPPELNRQDSHGVLDRRFYRH